MDVEKALLQALRAAWNMFGHNRVSGRDRTMVGGQGDIGGSTLCPEADAEGASAHIADNGIQTFVFTLGHAQHRNDQLPGVHQALGDGVLHKVVDKLRNACAPVAPHSRGGNEKGAKGA